MRKLFLSTLGVLALSLGLAAEASAHPTWASHNRHYPGHGLHRGGSSIVLGINSGYNSFYYSNGYRGHRPYYGDRHYGNRHFHHRHCGHGYRHWR